MDGKAARSMMQLIFVQGLVTEKFGESPLVQCATFPTQTHFASFTWHFFQPLYCVLVG